MEKVIIYQNSFDTKEDHFCYWYDCPKCGSNHVERTYNYCPICGVGIEWGGYDNR